MVTNGGLVVEFSLVGVAVVLFLFGPLNLLTIGLVDVSINGQLRVMTFTVRFVIFWFLEFFVQIDKDLFDKDLCKDLIELERVPL